MDIQEWKKLSSTEKNRMWDKLSEAEKDQIRSSRSQNRRSKHRRSGTSAYGGASGAGYFRSGWLPLALRVAGGIAILAAVLVLFIAPENLGTQGVLSPSFLILVLTGITCIGFGSLLERQAYSIDKLRAIEARLALAEEQRGRGRGGNQAQKASSADTTSSRQD
jgi:hypothetical protein